MTAPSASLARVRRGALCSGCGGCALVAPGKIEIEMSRAGFRRPVQVRPLTNAEDAAVAAICPGLGQRVEAGARKDHVLWGPYLDMRTGWASDPELRHAASSGGALSALLVHLLESGTVDAIVETGPDPADPVGNATVVAGDAEAILRAAGSRYAPSAPLAELGPLLESKARYAFVGKPCDVAALRALTARDPAVAARFPVVVSFFCAGVPSRHGAVEVLDALGVEETEVTAFRYRGHGWPGRARATLADGTERSMTYQESWGAVLSRHVQHRCKICADGTGTAADIVCADAWEADADGYPLFAEREGVSLIVSRTETGARILADAEACGRISTAGFDVASLAGIQPGQRGRRRVLAARLAALRLTGRPVPDYRGLQVVAAARGGRFTTLARNFAGMLYRVVRGRVSETE